MTLQRLARYSLALLLLLFNHLLVHAQEHTRIITGKVINSDTKEPMNNVSVVQKGSVKGAMTDGSGLFAVKVTGKGPFILSFSYVGFDPRDIKTNGDTALVIAMVNSNKKMDDVVVIGYGTQKRSNILGSIGTVNPKEVEDLPVANLSTALVNQVPGVSIHQSAGKPGASTSVTIRNAVSLNSQQTTPLFVIDGLAPIIGSGAGIDPTGKTAFDALDASEIESITFLKDGMATIYGARGANGVVLVTTKHGRPGKPRISYSGSYSNTRANKIPKMIDGYNQALQLNNWVENYPTGKIATTEIYTPEELDTIKARNYDWFKNEWIPNGSIQKHAINISGGSEKLTYFAGLNYYNEVGNLPNVVANRYGIQLGMTAKIIDGLTTDVSVNYNTGYNSRPAVKNTPTTDQVDQENGTVSALLVVPKWVPESINGNPVYYSPINWNPLAAANANTYARDNNSSFSLVGKITYQIPVVKGLSVYAQYGRNDYNDYGKSYYPSYNTYTYTQVGAHKNNGSSANTATGTQNVLYNDSSYALKTITNGNQLQNNYSGTKNWQATEGISYDNRFGDHEISATLVSEQEQTTGNVYSTTNSTQIIPGVDQIYAFSADGSNLNLSGQTVSTGHWSYLGRLNYSFKGRYLLQGSFRDDASPYFPIEHQWGFFPSGSVGWKISEEKFFEDNIHFLDDLKFRFNLGLTGNDAGQPFGWVERYTSNNGYLLGGVMTNGLSTTQVPNPNITWESALFKDLGVDGTFGNRKFNFTFDYWFKHGYNMLEPPQSTVTNTSGITNTASVNHGIINSWGTEFQLGYHQDINKDWSVFATVNFNWSDNKVIKEYYNPGTDTGYLYPIGKRIDQGITGMKSTGIVRTAAEAQAWNAKYPNWTVNKDTLRAGDLNFVDVNGDGKIDGNDQTQIAKRSSTLFGFGFILGAQWKGFRVSTNISLGIGGQMAWKKVDIAPPTKDAASLSMWKGAYSAWNTNAALPAIYAPFANQVSTFWLHSATYMYVNNLMLSWQVPVKFTSTHHLPEARFYLTGTDLWSIINPTPFKDPRSNEITDYPILRTWTFGANISL